MKILWFIQSNYFPSDEKPSSTMKIPWLVTDETIFSMNKCSLLTDECALKPDQCLSATIYGTETTLQWLGMRQGHIICGQFLYCKHMRND
jgi:hypothetical protein